MFRLLAYLFDFLIVVILGRLLNRVIRQFFGTPPTHPKNSRSAPARTAEASRGRETVRDPVCGMFVSTELSHRLAEGAQTLHFCSHECLERYQHNSANA